MKRSRGVGLAVSAESAASAHGDVSAEGDAQAVGPASGRAGLSRQQVRDDRALFAVLTLVQVVVSACAAFFELTNEMAFDACGERRSASVCNYVIADALFPIQLVSTAVIAVATVVWAVLRSLRGKRIWWLPLVASAAAVIVSIVLVAVIYKMINLSPFGE